MTLISCILAYCIHKTKKNHFYKNCITKKMKQHEKSNFLGGGGSGFETTFGDSQPSQFYKSQE